MENTIKLSRVKRGWTQGELARRAGIQQQRISAFECGLKARPKDIQKLVKAFGLAGDRE